MILFRAKMNSVFAKWGKARTEIVGKKEEEGEEEDAETIAQKKRADIEQWRTEQLKTYAFFKNLSFVFI